MAPPVLRSFDSRNTLATENLYIIFAQKQPYFNDTFLHYHIFILPSRKKVRFAHKIAPWIGVLRGSGGCGQRPGFHPGNAQKGAASKGFGGILLRQHHAVLYCIRGQAGEDFSKEYTQGAALFLLLWGEIQGDGTDIGPETDVLDSGGIQHPLGGQGGRGGGVLIG